MKNYKKISNLVLVVILMFTSTLTSFAQNDLNNNKLRDSEIDVKIEKLEKEIDQMEKVVFAKLKYSLEKVESIDIEPFYLMTGFDSKSSYTDYQFEKYNNEANLKQKEILLKYGFKPTENNEDRNNSIDPLSVSTDMTF